MRVLHLNNIAGVPPVLAKAQRKLGIDARVVVFRKDTAGFEFDYNLEVDRFPRAAQPFYRFYKLPGFLDYDIYHMHSSSFVSGYIDAPVLKSFGKKVVYHHHGSDIRGKGVPLLSRFCDLRFVSTPDLLHWAPDATWIPNPIETDAIKPVGKKSGNTVRILHAPRGKHEHRKSEVIRKAFGELSKEYPKAEFIFLEKKLSHADFMKELRKCDVYVDNLGGGWYGMTALEAMLSEIPVCVYIFDHLMKYCGDSSFVNVDENNLKRRLAELIEDKKLREKYGKNGRKYAMENHDSMKIARKVQAEYEKLF